MTRPATARGTSAGGIPHAVASAGSSRWNSQRSEHAASIDDGTAPGRSAVITQAMPTPAPSATMRSKGVVLGDVGGSVQRRAQGGQAVDRHDHLRPAVGGGPSPVELAGEAAQQPGQPLALVRSHHTRSVRDGCERVEPIVAARRR